MTVQASTQSAVTTIEQLYRERTPESARLFASASRSIPGGNSRQAGYWKPYPLCIDRAAGVYFYDVDGYDYIDLTFNYTAMVHGHAYPPIVEAVDLAKGTGWAANNRHMIDVAEQLVDRVASVDQVRFTNSGTEAGLLALTIARLVTGRYKVLMNRFGYHGSLMEFETGTFDHPGPATLLGEYNNLASFEAVLDEHGSDIAAVFTEPVMGAGGGVPAEVDFLRGLAAAARDAGALFVADEVITFRLGLGGWQGEVGLDPDLTMFGKLIGGGFPVGAVGGSKELMKVLEPGGGVFHSGTYNANPVTMAAGAVSVRELTAARIEEMHRLAERMEVGLRNAAEEAGIAFSMRRVGSMMSVYFSAEPPSSSMVREDGEIMSRFHLAALNRGLNIAPRGMVVLATVVDDAVVDEAVARASAAMRDVVAENR
ncbi:MAG: aminotransferase class III-fold pyridoxal phosphate-dependent enzyme [Acidobacteriota bacterium]|nr:aminotransferase class III-fold pyridoxal phosphate-dependent enzyme [Acidobacteriota bacterium]